MQFLGKMVHLRHYFKILDYFCILLPKQKIYFCEHLINSTILYSRHKKNINIKNGSNIVKSLSSVKYWLNLVATCSMWRNNIYRAYFLLFLEIWNQFIDATEIIDCFFLSEYTHKHIQSDYMILNPHSPELQKDVTNTNAILDTSIV